jgi:hypothetical protein
MAWLQSSIDITHLFTTTYNADTSWPATQIPLDFANGHIFAARLQPLRGNSVSRSFYRRVNAS